MDTGNEKVAYKLVRLRKNGTFGSLFIDRKKVLPVDVWMEAEDHPKKGYAHRPGWHVVDYTFAPQLKLDGRVWVKVLIKDYTDLVRPELQGGLWHVSKWMKIVGIETEAADIPHKSKRVKIGKKFCDIDEEIVELILTLNRIGLETMMCCQGDPYEKEDPTPPFVIFVGSEENTNRIWNLVCNFTKAAHTLVRCSFDNNMLDGKIKSFSIAVSFRNGKNAMEAFKKFVKIHELSI
jgi:hypothetical protein